MSNRISVPQELLAQLKYNCRNRCALCAGLNSDYSEKRGQVAHIDRKSANSLDYNNLVWLCLEHHDKYDSTTSQSKNYTAQEVRMYKAQLENYYQNPQNNELIKLLTEIVQLANDSDGYMFHFKNITLIECFIKESSYPEKYNLLKFESDLHKISRILQDILSIFSLSDYHSSGNHELIFNMGKSPDEVLEKNKKLYMQKLQMLNVAYRKFINSL